MDGTPTHGDLLCAFLADTDAPCPGCGYNLRGLTWSVCPECQRSISLAIEGTQPLQRIRPALLLGAVVVACLNCMFGIVMFVYQMFVSGMFTAQRDPFAVFYSIDTLVGVTLVVLGGVRLIGWYRRSRSPQRETEVARLARYVCWYVLMKGLVTVLWYIASLVF